MAAEKQSYGADIDDTLRSRVVVFEEEMERLYSLMYGETIPVWSYMTDDKGVYSEERTMRLVNQIVDEKRCDKMYGQEDEGQAGMSAFYQQILYCVLRVFTSGYTACAGGSRWGYGAPEEICFSHILSAFHGHGQEMLDGNVVFFMKTLYEIMAGKTICLDALSREEMETAGEGTDEEEAAGYETMEEALAEMYGYDIREIRNEEYRNIEETKRQAEAEKEKVIRFFPEKAHFCQSVEEVAFFVEKRTVFGDRLFADLKELIRIFLLDRGFSVFVDEEAYVEVMVQLKRTVRKAQKYTEG